MHGRHEIAHEAFRFSGPYGVGRELYSESGQQQMKHESEAVPSMSISSG